MKRIIVTIILLSLITGVSIANAQEQGNKLCSFHFRGKPRPECCSFLIFESGLLFGAAVSGEPPDKASFLITADLGLMFNRKNSSALGGSIHLVGDDNGTRFGIGPRYRKWLTRKTALDLSPRLIFGGDDNKVHRRFPGFAFSASLSLIDLISIDSYYQILPYNATYYYYSNPFGPPIPSVVKDTETGLYFGISGRSYLAPVVPTVAIILAVIVANSLDFSFSN